MIHLEHLFSMRFVLTQQNFLAHKFLPSTKTFFKKVINNPDGMVTIILDDVEDHGRVQLFSTWPILLMSKKYFYRHKMIFCHRLAKEFKILFLNGAVKTSILLCSFCYHFTFLPLSLSHTHTHTSFLLNI